MSLNLALDGPLTSDDVFNILLLSIATEQYALADLINEEKMKAKQIAEKCNECNTIIRKNEFLTNILKIERTNMLKLKTVLELYNMRVNDFEEEI